MATKLFEVTLESRAPLILSNNRCSDPLSEEAKIKSHFTSKRKKVDLDHLALRKIDWLFSGYWEIQGNYNVDDTRIDFEHIGFENLILPGVNLERSLRNGATAFKLGTEVKRSVVVTSDARLVYNGPTEANELFADKRFVDVSPVVRMKATNWVTRIKLPQWKATFQIQIDDARIPKEDFIRILNAAGSFEGIGTWRPRNGRYVATGIKDVTPPDILL